MAGLALFDVDHTLTKGDTLPAFLNYLRPGISGWICWLSALPLIAFWKLGLVDAGKAKSRLLGIFFSNTSEQELLRVGERFAAEVLPKLVNPLALNCLEQYKSAGFRCILVSASPELWISPWAKQLGVESLGTRLHFKEGRYSGFSGENNNGAEKVRRIKELLNPEAYSPIHAFGDSDGDKPMLALAHKGFYRTFPENFTSNF